ncbi:MAG: hypothetical protein JXA09_01095 [Anaerolineae bacterium]|nr:hypothetical protein [Anaerolineae bacterium]
MRAQLDIPRLLVVATLVAVFTMTVRVPPSPDMWWHLRSGEVQWRTRTILRADPFSHTVAGAPWVNHGWLPQLAMAALYALGGIPALALAVGLLVTVAFAFVFANGRTTGAYGLFWRAGVVIWATISAGRVWTARPHLITVVLTSAWVTLLDQQRRRDARRIGVLWALPPLMVLWANCHPGFVTGLVLLGIEIGARLLQALLRRKIAGLWAELRPLCAVAPLCALAVLVNPRGVDVIRPLFLTLGSPVQQRTILEWAPPELTAPDMLPFLALLLGTWGALLLDTGLALARRTPIRIVPLLRMAAFTLLGLRSGRNIGLCAIVAAPIWIEHGARAWQQLRTALGGRASPRAVARGAPLLNWAILALIVAASGLKVALVLNPTTIAATYADLYPVRAIAYLRDNDTPPTLFNDYGWGGYLTWALYPETPVFIDGRADMYGDELLLTYLSTLAAQPGWEETMDQYDVHTVLIDSASPLACALCNHDDWQVVYVDEMASVFVRERMPGSGQR